MSATARTGLYDQRQQDVRNGESGCHYRLCAVVERVGEVGELDGDGVVEVPNAPLGKVLVVGLEKLVNHPGLYLDHETGNHLGHVELLEDDQGRPESIERSHGHESERQGVPDAEVVEYGGEQLLQRRIGAGAGDYGQEQPKRDALQHRCQNDQREPNKQTPPQGGVKISNQVSEVAHAG